MSGVSISPYIIKFDNVTWTASWDDKGNISFKGIDKDGKEVGGNPPSEVRKAAKEYGASQGDKEQKTKEDTEDKQDTPPSLKNDERSNDEKSNTPEIVKKFKETVSHIGAASVSYSPKDKTIVAYDKDGNSISISSEDEQVLLQYFNSIAYDIKDKKSIKDKFKTIGKGLLKDAKEFGKLAIEPFRLAKDFYKTGKLIAQGRFRELRSRFALRIHDNLVAMDVLPKEIVNKIANEEKHENRLKEMGVTPDREPYMLSKAINRPKKEVNKVIEKLRGLTKSRVPSHVPISSSRQNHNGKTR